MFNTIQTEYQTILKSAIALYITTNKKKLDLSSKVGAINYPK